MKMPPLIALRAFEAAARLESFSRAGDELHVTHAAISHQIKQLEEWFGRPLFRRVGRGVELTRLGKTIAASVTPAFVEISQVCQRMRLPRGRGALSVGCIPSIASRWLIPNLALFSSWRPEIDLQVLYATAQARLSSGDYDVLITLGEDPSASVSNRKLFSRSSQPVCSPHYLGRTGRSLSKPKIGSAELLHDETRDGWEQWFRAAHVEPPRRLAGPIFQDFNLLATAVIAGQGVALCPTEIFRLELSRGDLVILSDVRIFADDGYFLISDKTPALAVGQFSDWFVMATA